MNEKTPKYINIKNKIKEEIKDGIITDKLPGERVLAQQLDASYMTIRKAVTELVEEGILHKNTTKGTYVSSNKMSPKITHNIGFFLDEGIKDGISSPYYSLVFNALEKEVKKIGYNLTLFSDFDDLNPLRTQKKIDGVIISCFPRIESKIQEIKRLIPIVLIDNISADKSIPSVTLDNFNGCSESAEYLVSLGHTRIGFVSGLMDSDICKERVMGYTSILNNSGLETDEKLIYKGDYFYNSGEKAAKYFLSLPNPPTAIICANDTMAIGIMKGIQESGLSIPNDISIIGFDDIDVASRVFPSLTTTAAPISKIAEKSVSMLMSAIKGDEIEYKHIILPAHLKIRNSCSAKK